MTLGAAVVSDGIIVPTPDGALNTRFPDGDDGSPTSFTIAATPVDFETIEITLVVPATGAPTPLEYFLQKTVDTGPLGTWLAVANGENIFVGGYDDTGLLDNTTYYYRAYAENALNQRGKFSATVSATTPEEVIPEPTVPAKITGVTIGSVTSTTFEDISWNADPDATSYRFFVGFGNGAGQIIPGQIYIDTTTTFTFKESVTGLASEQEYYVQIFGLNSVGQGEGSTPLFFTTDPLPAVEPADHFVRLDGEDGAFTTIQAAINAAVAGERIEVRANVPGGTAVFASVVSQRNGTSGNPIVLYGRTGDKIYIDQVITAGGVKANVHMNHNWLDWGQNLIVRGAMPYTTPNNTERCVSIKGLNFISRFSEEEARLHWVWVNATGASGRVTGGYSFWSGVIDNGGNPPKDGGDGIEFNNSACTLDHKFIYGGGHSCVQLESSTDILCAYYHADSLWDKIDEVGHVGVTTDGNRVQTSQGCSNAVIARAVIGPAGNTYEPNQAIGPIWRCPGVGIIVREVITAGVITKYGPGFGQIANNTFAHPVDNYYYNGVIANITGSAIGFSSNRTIDADYGPFYIKNYIFFNCNTDPVGSDNTYISIKYRSTAIGANGWVSKFFFDTIIVPSLNVPVIIDDQDNADPTISTTIGALAISHPTNFANIIAVNANFVNSITPRVQIYTPWNENDWQIIRDNWTPRAVQALGAGTHVTRVNGAVGQSTTVIVDDGGWINTTNIGGGYLVGDPIFNFYIEGFGTVQFASKTGNTLVADREVTCADNARIWPGTSSTPNIGWIL